MSGNRCWRQYFLCRCSKVDFGYRCWKVDFGYRCLPMLTIVRCKCLQMPMFESWRQTCMKVDVRHGWMFITLWLCWPMSTTIGIRTSDILPVDVFFVSTKGLMLINDTSNTNVPIDIVTQLNFWLRKLFLQFILWSELGRWRRLQPTKNVLLDGSMSSS